MGGRGGGGGCSWTSGTHNRSKCRRWLPRRRGAPATPAACSSVARASSNPKDCFRRGCPFPGQEQHGPGSAALGPADDPEEAVVCPALGSQCSGADCQAEAAWPVWRRAAAHDQWQGGATDRLRPLFRPAPAAANPGSGQQPPGVVWRAPGLAAPLCWMDAAIQIAAARPPAPQYITTDRLRADVQAALRQAGGRLELVELPALVGVDLVHCEKQVRPPARLAACAIRARSAPARPAAAGRQLSSWRVPAGSSHSSRVWRQHHRSAGRAAGCGLL